MDSTNVKASGPGQAAHSVDKQDDVKLNDSTKRIPKRQQIAYGFGDFGNGFMFDLGQSYLTKFWIDGVGIGSGVVAGIFAFTKIFDAFMDPIAGSVIDNRKHIGKQGKFRPVMMISAIILGIMTVITFTMPDGLSMTQKIIYAYAAYMIWIVGFGDVKKSARPQFYGNMSSGWFGRCSVYCWGSLHSADGHDWW